MHPCNNCSSRGLGSTCAYSTTTSRPSGQAHVQDRINQLESLVLSLMQQSPMNTGPSPPEDISPQSTLDKRPAAQGPSSSEQSPEYPKTSRSGTQRGVSPSPSDYGSLSIRQSGVTYVSSAHWVAILDSIAELKHNFAQEEEADEPPPDPVLQQQTTFPVPQLLYSNSLMTGSRDSILEAIPPRSDVDRLVSCYFNSLDLAPGKQLCSLYISTSQFENRRFIQTILVRLLTWQTLTDGRLGIIHSQKFLREVYTPHKPDLGYLHFLFLTSFPLHGCFVSAY